MTKTLCFSGWLVLLFSACQVLNFPSTPFPLETMPTAQSVEPTPTIIVTPTVVPSPTFEPSPTPTTATPPIGRPLIQEQAGDLYTSVFSIPVGEENLIQYQGADIPEMPITGPNALALLPDGTFLIADPIANRLLNFDRTGNLLNQVELYDLGIVNVTDVRADEEKLVLLEISLDFSPPRYRVNQLSFEGKLLASEDIPESFGIDKGLTGIAIDCDGSVLLELEGGFRLVRLQDLRNNPADAQASGYNCAGKFYRVVESDSPEIRAMMAGDVRYETRLTGSFGSLALLKVFRDGSFTVVREDVVEFLPEITVDQTVHYLGADGSSQAVARVLLAEMYYPILRSVAVSDSGEGFFLLPRSRSLDVVRLNFYRSLNPLPPSSVVPEVIRAPASP